MLSNFQASIESVQLKYNLKQNRINSQHTYVMLENNG
jgi:hypothetical protein